MTLTQKGKYGQIEITDNKKIKVVGGLNPKELSISDLIIIGEYTTDNGPFLDDWFLTLVTLNEWIEISMYTVGMTKFLKDLSKVVNADLSTSLANSSIWKTRIMFPNELKEKELFEVEDIEPKSLLGKVKKQITGGKSARKLSSEILKILER